MKKNNSFIEEHITAEEALSLLEFVGTQELGIVSRLYKAYNARKDDLQLGSYYGFLALLSFVYDTGRVQGIREERAKRK